MFEGPTNEFFPHHGQLKPFAVSPLLHRGGDRVEWWTTWMPDDLVPPILGAPVEAELGDLPIRLEPAGVLHRSFRSLREHEPVTRAEVVFLSPTRFSRNGVSWVLPDPFLLFGNLERRWRSLAPPELVPPPKVGTELARLTHVAAADITTV
ncbi:MAG: hypothetical protein N2037_11905, partial [Acidimicrobiales bacterium]|nr:hypothetical protein [Acidimicrobiales bacterium]